MKPVLAIVGRPNVGKSTLMNRIIGRREAIVQELPGVTRDRKVVPANWNGRDFMLVDTGGWMSGGSALDKKVSKQSEKAISEADVVLFVVDANVGVTDDDLEVARLMQRIDRPVMVIANKVDENVLTGTLVGLTAQAIDPDGDRITYSLLDNAGGRFTIASGSGIVSVADGSLIDYESNRSYTVIVQASDRAGNASQESFVIGVNNLPETGLPTTGTDGDDRLLATTGNDTIRGLDGNDFAWGSPDLGGSDSDLMFGGAGNDRVAGRAGNDTVYGDAGNDLLGGGKKLLIGSLVQMQFTTSRNWPFGAALSFLLMYATFIAIAFQAMKSRQAERRQ